MPPRKKAPKKSPPSKRAAKKQTTRTPAKTAGAKRPAPVPASAPPAAASYRARVRMYRHGLGDCFLVTFPREDGTPYYIVIDCGVILGTQNAADKMKAVVQSISDTTGRHVDLLIATHEHWDHLSGMIQARDLWQTKLTVDQVWLGWTEDPSDSLARKLSGERNQLRIALTTAAQRMHLAGATDAANEVSSMLEFFGAAGSGTTADAMAFIKKLTPKPRYCFPNEPPTKLAGTSVTAYVLGPPHDEKLIKKYNPSAKSPETYGMQSMSLFFNGVTASPEELDAPFDPNVQVPLDAARQMPFFQDSYWGEDRDSEDKDQSWRRIDSSWLECSSTMALQLDSATNNTCLVVAFELDGGDVLLFAADAQVGNWLSWQQLSWKVDKQVTGPDLLHRTIFYKVGHHGSHNATLKEQGLEEMTSIKLAFVPVDHEMAVKKHWGRMPFPELMDALEKKTDGNVVRIDADLPKGLQQNVTKSDLFYEVSF